MCDARDCDADSTCVVEFKGPLVEHGRLELDLCDPHAKVIRNDMLALMHGVYTRPKELSRRCLLVKGHNGGCILQTRKPILDRMQDGEFRGRNLPIEVPGVSVPANLPRCAKRSKELATT